MKKRTTDIFSSLFIRRPELSVIEAACSKAVQLLIECFRSGGKLLVCGNGGSAADSEHIVGELMKGFLLKRPLPDEHKNLLLSSPGNEGHILSESLQGAVPAFSLVSQTSLSSAIANDTSADMVFAQQVYGYGKPGDVLIGLSTSGNARNVVNAFQVAKTFQMHTIAFTGASGGKLSQVSSASIQVPSDSTPEIQEYHVQVYHALCGMIESEFFDE